MKPFKLSIKERHIRKGERKKASSCPIALAMLEARPKAWVGVLGTFIDLGMKSKTYLVRLPRKAENFILDFDGGRVVKPFSFIARPERVDK